MDARRDVDQAVSLVGWWKFARRAGDGGAFNPTNDKSMYEIDSASQKKFVYL
jgi:hypothetical protein